ncbi:MinD/ParA family protein [Alteribacter aurantiacus]|uniref:MinD/ParA family protein n=1 Tax=Alteribacter aurantiacus TaxID=254410 RepID=UPI0004023950|nr:MinD/ParA family protein [Alteribacter aurantiacus]
MVHKDQASQLRLTVNEHQKSSTIKPVSTKAHVMAVVSGKGGVGKSNFVVNFSLALTNVNKKVLIIDLDLGMANIDLLMGKTSKHSMIDMMKNKWPITTIVEKARDDLHYVTGGSALAEFVHLHSEDLEFFTNELSSIVEDYDVILLDFGAGITSSGTKLLFAAHDVIVVTTPEPTSLTDGYGMIKFIHKEDPLLPVHLLVNQTKNQEQALAITSNIKKVCRSFLNKKIEFFGFLPKDNVVWESVCNQRPYIKDKPQSKVSKAMVKVAYDYCGKPKTDRYPFVTKLKGWLTNK